MSTEPTPPKLKNPPTIPAETAAKTPLPTLLLSEVNRLRPIAAFDRLMLGELSPATRALIAVALGGAL